MVLSQIDSTGMLCGGVITSENAWQHYLTKYSDTATPMNSLPNDKFNQPPMQPGFDTSSYEYSIQLLCQSLQVDIATKRIEEYCTIHHIRFKGTAKIIQNQNNDRNNSNNKNDNKTAITLTSTATVFETLAVIYLALSRAYAMMLVLFLPITDRGECDDTTSNHHHYGSLLWTSCQRCLSAIKLSRTMLLQQHSNDIDESNSNNDAVTTTTNYKSKKDTTNAFVAGSSGGKRGWKTGQQPRTGQSTQREFSNVAYRTHRLSELEMDVLSLLKHCKDKNASNHIPSGHSAWEESIHLVTHPLQHKLLYFSGGAMTSTTSTTDQSGIKNSKVRKRKSLKHQQKQNASSASIKPEVSSIREHLLVASWYSFGLSQIFATLTKKQNQSLDNNTSIGENSNAIDENYNKYMHLQSVLTMAGKSVIHDDGMMNIKAIFDSTDRPLDIEIGAGFGSWIVEQAYRNTNRNYIAMELRADRCYQIYTRAMLQYTEPLSNVCVVGCDCNVLLRERISHNTVSTFYAHHPEPPTQVLGDNIKFLHQLSLANNTSVVEPVHMLHSTTIRYMCQCLKKDGYIVIVSDNRSYIRLLAATFAKVVREDFNLLRTIALDQVKNGIIGSFDEAILQSIRSFETFQSVVEIYAYENSKMETKQKQNSSNDGTSYFDRLWRTGAGTHSETHTRFVIVMQKQGSGAA